MLLKTKPYAHQQHAIDMACERKNFAYFMEQGTGKSLCLIADALHLYNKQLINLLVIAAPKGCFLNWSKNELPKHIPDNVPYIVETWTPKSQQGKDKRAALQQFCLYPMPFLKVFVINIEAFAMKDTYDFMAVLLKKHKSMLAIDESTFIRNPSARRHMYARRLRTCATYARILTGTPIANKPLDLYGQCVFLDGDLLGFSSFQAFKHYYADIGYFRGGRRLNPQRESIHGPGIFPQIVGYKNQEELIERLKAFSFRVLKEDCLDLPPKVYERRYVEITSEQRKAYNEMRDNLMVQHQSGQLATAAIALTKLLRLQTILCGHLKLDNSQTVYFDSNRVNVWADLVEELDGKIITFCQFKDDIKLLTKNLDPKTYGCYYGETTDSERASSLHRFKNDPACTHFFATLATGGVGLTLNEASSVIYFSNGYDLEKRAQSEDRCHRIGQTKKVTYYDLVCPDTVDEVILKALEDKEDLSLSILSKIKSYVPKA